MNIKPIHENFIAPTKGTDKSGGYDLYMPEAGSIFGDAPVAEKVKLGFAAEIPEGHVGILLPRSGKGVNFGLELNNTAGIIDADYRGEWMVAMRMKNQGKFTWEAGERLFQLLIVPVASVEMSVVDALDDTERGEGGWGSTG